MAIPGLLELPAFSAMPDMGMVTGLAETQKAWGFLRLLCKISTKASPQGFERLQAALNLYLEGCRGVRVSDLPALLLPKAVDGRNIRSPPTVMCGDGVHEIQMQQLVVLDCTVFSGGCPSDAAVTSQASRMETSIMTGKENLAVPANLQGPEDLASLLQQGSKLIQTHQCVRPGKSVSFLFTATNEASVAQLLLSVLRRTKDLFKQLETRSLTEDEESVIQQRVLTEFAKDRRARLAKPVSTTPLLFAGGSATEDVC